MCCVTVACKVTSSFEVPLQGTVVGNPVTPGDAWGYDEKPTPGLVCWWAEAFRGLAPTATLRRPAGASRPLFDGQEHSGSTLVAALFSEDLFDDCFVDAQDLFQLRHLPEGVEGIAFP